MYFMVYLREEKMSRITIHFSQTLSTEVSLLSYATNSTCVTDNFILGGNDLIPMSSSITLLLMINTDLSFHIYRIEGYVKERCHGGPHSPPLKNLL